MHGQNINLPVCVCVCVHHTFCQLAYRSDHLTPDLNPPLWVVSYGGKTISRWRTAAILKIDISPYLSENHPIS